MKRDLEVEAIAWRANLRHPFLSTLLADLDAERLVAAYRAWYRAYSTSIQKAPSNRMGISSTDAAAAAESAYRAVRDLLATPPEASRYCESCEADRLWKAERIQPVWASPTHTCTQPND